jgi:threonine synthase
VCSVCQEAHDADEIQNTCRKCGKILLSEYDIEAVRKDWKKEDVARAGDSFWKYLPVLPLRSPSSIVSLGERITPMLRLSAYEREAGVGSVWVKDEASMPTGSFKARGLGMAVTKAAELGVTHICIPSAGNAAGACAAYAARAGIGCTIVVPDDTPQSNIEESRVYGAEVILVEGTISDAGKHLQGLKKEHPDWFDVSTFKEPYRLEGKKTMGYEVGEQFEWKLPDVIVYPTGGGTGLVGMWKAFDEMERLGWIGSARPRMVSSQAAECAPIVKAFSSGATETKFWEGARTDASGLRVPKPFADYLILTALRESKGSAVAVTDDEAAAEIRSIGRMEGFFFSPEGATTAVAYRKLAAEGWIRPEETVLLWNTASASKYPGFSEKGN